MTPPQNARSSLHTRRAVPNHARSAKPPPLTSRKSYGAPPTKKSPTSKTGPGWSKAMGKREAEIELDDEDMAGLPQFCATCEKQIVTPSNSILYCSESCRKKDHNKPLEESILPPLSPQISSRRTSYFGDEVPPDFSPMRSPVTRRPPSLAFSDSSDSSSFHDRRSSYARNDSDAAQYLSHFLPSDPAVDYGFQGTKYDRHRPTTSHSAAPSLSHTPISIISTSGSYRPLPRRGDPFSASFSSFSVDLITPVINIEPSTVSPRPQYRTASVGSVNSTGTAFCTAEGQMTYEKKPFSPEPTLSPGSLKQLFSHNAMHTPVRTPTSSRSRRSSKQD